MWVLIMYWYLNIEWNIAEYILKGFQKSEAVTIETINYILLFSFQVGDLVLIILDERHDNYVLFTVSPTLYFLHSESLPALDLKPGEGGKCHIHY